MRKHPLDHPGSQAAMWLDLLGRDFSECDVVGAVRGGQVTIMTHRSPHPYRVGVRELRPIGPVARELLKACK